MNNKEQTNFKLEVNIIMLWASKSKSSQFSLQWGILTLHFVMLIQNPFNDGPLFFVTIKVISVELLKHRETEKVSNEQCPFLKRGIKWNTIRGIPLLPTEKSF